MNTGRRPVARSEQQPFRAGGQQTAVDTLDVVPTYAFLDAPTLAFAHRGGHEVAPENTLRAFRAAVDLGYRHLETDVHVTADGSLVAFHDDRLDRVTDSTGPIVARTTAELRDVHIDGTDPIPTLDELLEDFPDVRWNLDPKSDAALGALAAVIRRHGAIERVNIGSFSDTRLRRMRALLGTGLCTAAGPREVAGLVVAAHTRGVRHRRGRPAYGCVQVPVSYGGVRIVTPAFLDAAHARGAQVHVWTIDDPGQMHHLLDLGVDGIMTDRPSVLRQVLRERAAWP